MARVVAIDYGLKRTGLAISDPLRMIANGLDTVDTRVLMDELKRLFASRHFDTIVVGEAKRNDGSASDIEHHISRLIKGLSEAFPDVEIVRMDERFTSKLAIETLIAAGASKKRRRQKGMIDKVSATLILQDYLNTV